MRNSAATKNEYDLERHPRYIKWGWEDVAQYAEYDPSVIWNTYSMYTRKMGKEHKVVGISGWFSLSSLKKKFTKNTNHFWPNKSLLPIYLYILLKSSARRSSRDCVWQARVGLSQMRGIWGRDVGDVPLDDPLAPGVWSSTGRPYSKNRCAFKNWHTLLSSWKKTKENTLRAGNYKWHQGTCVYDLWPAYLCSWSTKEVQL